MISAPNTEKPFDGFDCSLIDAMYATNKKKNIILYTRLIDNHIGYTQIKGRDCIQAFFNNLLKYRA